MPCNIQSIPYVAIKEGNRKKVTSNPLARPISAPLHRPVRKPRVVEPVEIKTVPAKQADIPTFAPTDKSIPAVRITRVKPDAIKNNKLACLRTFSKLLVVRNASDNEDKTKHISKTTNNL